MLNQIQWFYFVIVYNNQSYYLTKSNARPFANWIFALTTELCRKTMFDAFRCKLYNSFEYLVLGSQERDLQLEVDTIRGCKNYKYPHTRQPASDN